MAKRLNRDEAMLHLVYLVAKSDYKSGGWFGIGEGDLITDEEEEYLKSVSKREKMKLDWSVFSDQMGDWVDDEEKLWAKSCNVMKRASKSERLKTLKYMAGMANASREDDDESNISDIEWALVIRTSKELDVYDEYMEAIG
jgi:hypothetical protein